MPYKLLLSEEISPAVRRIALEQLTRARRELSAANNMQEGVHQSRKCLKKLRSLLRLARPIIGEEVFRAENKTYRDIGRALARPRDAGALVETIIKFETRDDLKNFRPLFLKLKQKISEDQQAFEAELEIVALSHIVETLDASLARWRNMPLPQSSFEDIAHGFAFCYDRGRESLKVALRKNSSFYMHEWRKDVQQTWRHMQMLTLIWPEDIMPRIRLAQDISRLMGTEHDISELLIYMKQQKKLFRKSKQLKALRKPFQRVAKTIQRDLCLHAAERGRRLYAFEAAAIAEAMTVYWKTAQAMQPLPGLVSAMANIETAPPRKVEAMRQQTARPPRQASQDADDKAQTIRGKSTVGFSKVVPIREGQERPSDDKPETPAGSNKDSLDD
ncbi:MAG: hypothetical protein DHS20C08_14790 [Rhodomicrobium sp.]|nr:MAG: hypothetical protein DHS20C08_14790 [Rhodomicrobium sp.]